MIFFSFKKNSLFFLALILLLSAFLRFYRLSEYMQFLGDQGRDAMAVRQILVDHHFPAIGPPSSVGTVYLGPFYYYMMASSMLFFWLNPVAAAGMVALIGVATVFLIYYITNLWFGRLAAFLAAFFYAISPVVINYSRFSWNPNPVPLFTLLAFIGMYLAHKNKDLRYFILVGFSLGAVIQMHYLTLILIPIFFLLWLNELRIFFNQKKEMKFFWLGTEGAILGFIILALPIFLFDLKNHFLNFYGLINLFSGANSQVSLTFADSLGRIINTYVFSLIGRYIAGQNGHLSILISLLILIPLAEAFYLYCQSKKLSWIILAITIWFFAGFFLLSFYKGEIYDHYLAFLSPLPFILLGALLSRIGQNMKGLVLIAILTVTVAYFNLEQNPLLYPPNRQLQRTQEIALFIIDKSSQKPFNFALLAQNNYDSAYQFYLEQYGHKPKMVPAEKTDQLFVVCEDQICQPVGNPKFEIAAFGWAKEEWESQVASVKVFKLIPNSAQPNR